MNFALIVGVSLAAIVAGIFIVRWLLVLLATVFKISALAALALGAAHLTLQSTEPAGEPSVEAKAIYSFLQHELGVRWNKLPSVKLSFDWSESEVKSNPALLKNIGYKVQENGAAEQTPTDARYF